MNRLTKLESEKPERPLERYLRVLEVISAFSAGISLKELTDVLELPKTTVHRLLGSLIESRAIEPSESRRDAYVLGKRVLQMLYVGSPDNWIELLTRPALSELAEVSGFTAFVVRLTDNAIRSVATFTEGSPTVHTYVVPGRDVWPHAGATGKAILAHQPKAVVDRMLPSPLPALTPYTITSRDELEAEFARVRDSGYAFCKGEDVLGFGGIGAPVEVLKAGVIYAVGITGPSELLFQGRELEYVDMVRHAAHRVQVAIQVRASQEGVTDESGAERRLAP